MDDLAVSVVPFGLVGEEVAVLGEELLPVAGDVLHSQVLQDEPLPPVAENQIDYTHTLAFDEKENIFIDHYLMAISCATSSLSLTNCKSSLRG